MHIFADSITNRLVYTLDFVFKSRGIEYVLTENLEAFEASVGNKLNYSSLNFEVSSIIPASLLFDDELSNPIIEKSTFNKAECLSLNGISDPFATVFYILSRYEEYLCKEKDQHGRFPFEKSILNQFGWIEQCVCDRIAHGIFDFCGLKTPSTGRKPNIVPTFDIDNTYAYKLKSGRRRFLSVSRDVVKFDKKRLGERRRVDRGEKDPYDTFDLISEIAQSNAQTKVFWLVGNGSKKDRNVSIEHPEHQALIRQIGAVAEVNLHPSYVSDSNAAIIKMEKKALEEIIGTPVLASRQHFLRFQLPETYRTIIACGFSHEYSMGFAEHIGFRAGTARAHHWFDLEKNEVTKLMVHPFAYMDGTLNEYMGLTIEQSKLQIKKLYDEVATLGGDFLFIWHNETVGNYNHWMGWQEVLNFTLNLTNE